MCIVEALLVLDGFRKECPSNRRRVARRPRGNVAARPPRSRRERQAGQARWITLLLVVVGAIMGSVLTSALRTLLGPHDLPGLTVPFCAVATIMAVGGPAHERVWRGHVLAAPPSATSPGTTVTFADLWQGLLNGVGQVFFQGKWYVGLIFLIGLAFAGWRVAGAALAAGAVGILVAVLLGAPAADIGAGLYGYNAVLTGIALCCAFVVPTVLGLLYALAGVVATTVLTAFVGYLFAPALAEAAGRRAGPARCRTGRAPGSGC
ncbi:urea transporter [Actinomadura sp. ATCC 39365]